MKLKALMITTIACSAMTQFAMADIILTDSNDAKVTIANDGKCTYATENGFFRAYEGLKSIEIKDIAGDNAQDLSKTFKTLLKDQYNQSQKDTISVSIENSDASKIGGAYEYIIENLTNIKNLTFKDLKIADFLKTSLSGKQCFAQGATLTIENADTDEEKGSKQHFLADLSALGAPNITTLNVSNNSSEKTSYFHISNYANFKNLANMNVTGDVYWSDDPVPAKDDFAKKEYHGGALCTFNPPINLRSLVCDLTTWIHRKNYYGYTGIGIEVKDASSDLKLKIGKKTSALYIIDGAVDAEHSYTPKIITNNQIQILSSLTVPAGSTLTSDCYRVQKVTPHFLWGGTTIQNYKKDKENVIGNPLQISTSNQQITIDGSSLLVSTIDYTNKADREAKIEEFNQESDKKNKGADN